MKQQITWQKHTSTGPEPACGISFGVAKWVVRGWMNKNHYQAMGVSNWTQTSK
jgi:hypothetical protein